MDKSIESEISLLRASIKGSSDAFEGLVCKYQSMVCAITYSAIGDVEKSKELAQETFVRAWKNLKQLRDQSRFRSWLCSIAKSTIKNYFRNRKHDIIHKAGMISDTTDMPSDTPDPSDNLIAKEQQAVVDQALQSIPESYRQPLVLFYRQEQSVSQVAEQLEMSVDNVRTRLHRGRKMLKEQVVAMVESTLSSNSPGKAFTACVMASIAGIVIKGTGAAAAATGTMTAAAATTGVTIMSGLTAKIVIAVTAIAIAVGGAVVYKNMKSPPVRKDKPVQVADGTQESETNETVGAAIAHNSEDENITSLQPDVSIIKPVEVAASTTSEPEIEKIRQYIDPNTLTDIYLKHVYHYQNGSSIQLEYRFKEPDYWYWIDPGDMTKISNGKEMLLLNEKEMTAQLSNSVGPKPNFHDQLMFAIKRLGYDLVNERLLGKEFQELISTAGEIEYELVSEESSKDISVYLIKIPQKHKVMEMSVEVGAQTGLVQRVTVPSGPDDWFEFILDYSDIALDVFSMKVPEGYRELTENLPPTFQGWIFDKDLKPVQNAVIYLFGDNRSCANGKSDSKGEFNFNIPVANGGANPVMEYPIFVRTVSKDHPDQVAWTVIQSPESKEKLPSIVPSPGDVQTETKEKKCYAAHNVTLVLEDAATISGQIRDTSNDKPIKNALVTLRASYDNLFSEVAGAGERGDFQVKTDAKGFYVFESVPTFILPEKMEDETVEKNTSRSQKTRVLVSARKEGYFDENSGFELKSTESLTNRNIDISLVPATVTVRGRLIDEDGEPVAGYAVCHCFISEKNINRSGSFKRTNENGEYELTGCAYDENLSVKVIASQKADWDDHEINKGREFIYCLDKTVPVPFKEGKYEYEVEIVLEKPKVVVLFEVKDIAGKPIEGMPVLLRSDFYGAGRVLTDEWAQSLWGVTGKDGTYTINGLPEMDHIAFDIQPFFNLHFLGKPANDAEKEMRERLSEYERVYRRINKIPVDKKGYLIEVTMTKKGEKIDGRKQVKIFDSNNEEITW